MASRAHAWSRLQQLASAPAVVFLRLADHELGSSARLSRVIGCNKHGGIPSLPRGTGAGAPLVGAMASRQWLSRARAGRWVSRTPGRRTTPNLRCGPRRSSSVLTRNASSIITRPVIWVQSTRAISTSISRPSRKCPIGLSTGRRKASSRCSRSSMECDPALERCKR
jgi:hypothetical protein